MKKRSFPRGEYIFREGETGGYAYILAEGDQLADRRPVVGSPSFVELLQDRGDAGGGRRTGGTRRAVLTDSGERQVQ